jgi:radial spoke head protein 9
MLHSSLSEDISLLWPTGVCLNIEEKMNLKLSLLRIHELDSFEEVLFWGKIKGSTRDYYIAMSLNYKGQYEFPHKRFFWCTSLNWKFVELSAINPNDQELVELHNVNFTGEHEKILKEAPAVENEEENKEEENADKDSLASTEEDKVPPKNFIELDRLAYVVRAIDHDCSVVPEGAFRITPAHELTRNKAFEGLARKEVGNIRRYLHFRNVQSTEKRDQLDTDDALFTYDFLDLIEKDVPVGSWSLQVDPSGNLGTLKNFLWPGFFAFHLAGTSRFGSVYIGEGVKNADLPFML